MTNGKNVAIDIKKVKYYNQSEARWVTENVKNKSEHCAKGQVCQMDKEDLGNAENDALTKFIFIYQDSGSNVEKESATFVPTSPECRAEKIYGFGQVWTISEATSTTTKGSGACDVKFEYVNGRTGTIKVTSVKYFTGGKWKTENLAANSNECPKDRTCQTDDVASGPDSEQPQQGVLDVGGAMNSLLGEIFGANGKFSSLGGVEGADITKIQFAYKFLPPAKGSNWSDKVTSSVFMPSDPKCTDNKIYGRGQKWTIK